MAEQPSLKSLTTVPNLCTTSESLNSNEDHQNCEKCDTVRSQLMQQNQLISSSLISSPLSLLPKTVESESQTDSIEIPLEDVTLSKFCNSDQADQHDNDHHQNSNSVSCIKMTTGNQSFQIAEPVEPVQKILLPIKQIDEDQQPDSMEIFSKYFNEPEVSLIQIDEKLIDRNDDRSDNRDDPETVSTSVLLDSESEEDDQLKPLMTDIHNQELYNISKRQIEKIVKHAEIKDLVSSAVIENDRTFSNYVHYKQPFFLDHHGCDSSDLQSSDDIIPDPDRTIDEIKEIDTLTRDEIPDDRMSEEIVEQVEFYFSNDNILKDAFLLKHVRRNKEGFVSLKLVSSFKRVRQLTKDWRVVGYAIRRKSRKIELNDLGTKIRRFEPLPTFDETMPSRTIVACDLPVDKLTIERVSDIFSKCGEIALIRILRPGTAIPVDVRQFMNKYPEMQQKDCALIEFVESHSARIAQNMCDHYNVFEMVAPKKKTGKKAITMTKLIENYKYSENNNYERNRGGIMIPMENDFKYKLRRNNSEYYVKPDLAHLCTQRKYSYSLNNNNNNYTSNNPESSFIHYPRRTSNYSVSSSDNMSRKYSSCSEGYSSCSELSRRPSTCSSNDQSRRGSNCSEYCPCSRRGSQCTGSNSTNPELQYRRIPPQYNDYNNVRKYSNSPTVPFDRSFSNPQEMSRRMSFESNYDRKLSTGSIGSDRVIHEHEPIRKYSNGYDPNRKLSNTDQYFNGRRLSSDSGYDRRMSFGSDYGTSPRSRSNSFMTCQHKNTETVVRTPIGPDGSKGFTSRARKVGQIIAPV